MVMQNIQRLIGGITAPAALRQPAQTQMPFKTTLLPAHGDTGYKAADVITKLAALEVLGAGAKGKIWQLTVPAQQKLRWGFGSPATPANQGYMWFGYGDATNNEVLVGMLRLVQANARETKVFTVGEIDDSQLHAACPAALTIASQLALINKNEMMALPEKREFPLVGEDSLLQLWYEVITVLTGVVEIGSFSIPITVYQ